MSDGEGFIARWSRRKRAALSREPARTRPELDETGARVPTEAPPDAEPVLDLAALPPIESIGPGSDVRAFLAPGVPASLARAALRRAWSADPAIRDFIGLSENSWDFTTPAGVPGFGALTAEDAERLLARLQPDPASLPDQAAEPISKEQMPEQVSAAQSRAAERLTTSPEEATVDRLGDAEHAAVEHGSGREPSRTPKPRRHGGALPE